MNLNIPFMSYRKIATIASFTLLVLSMASLGLRGLNLGLDFSGGTLIEVSYSEAADLGDIRDLMAGKGFDDFQVVNFGSNSDVLIKVAASKVAKEAMVAPTSDTNDDSKLGDVIFTLLQAADPSIELKRIEFVGPQIGDELRDQGGLGMLVALGMILLYVAFRFQYKFALGAVAALAHDVVIILGLFSLLAWDFDLTVLAALLAVIGYSLNDTIVVSDRIRENFRGERGFEPEEIVNRSINQTLSRTLITSFTTLLVLFALFFFGGEMIRGFSQALIIGVLVGTYSSIYVVANMLLGLSITQDDLAIPEPEGLEFDDMP
jgi:preprotein translocase subunit SecF